MWQEWILLTVLICNLAAELWMLLLPPVVIQIQRFPLLRRQPHGMAFLNLVVIRSGMSNEWLGQVLRHELEHIEQQKRFTPLGCAIIMIMNMGWLLIRYRSLKTAYWDAFLEKQARSAMDCQAPLPHLWFWPIRPNPQPPG
jgi:hypothetical protein